jgi:hypothetical protein
LSSEKVQSDEDGLKATLTMRAIDSLSIFIKLFGQGHGQGHGQGK